LLVTLGPVGSRYSTHTTGTVKLVDVNGHATGESYRLPRGFFAFGATGRGLMLQGASRRTYGSYAYWNPSKPRKFLHLTDIAATNTSGWLSVQSDCASACLVTFSDPNVARSCSTTVDGPIGEAVIAPDADSVATSSASEPGSYDAESVSMWECHAGKPTQSHRFVLAGARRSLFLQWITPHLLAGISSSGITVFDHSQMIGTTTPLPARPLAAVAQKSTTAK
jgi:hypothetical protein